MGLSLPFSFPSSWSFSFSLSLLPAHLAYIEIFLVRLFLLLALLTIGPWLSLIVYDFLLYVFRIAFYDVPFVGGRARGRTRPRAPSVNVRPDGTARRFSLGQGVASARAESRADADGNGSGHGHGNGNGVVMGDGEVFDSGKGRAFRRLVREEERSMRSWEIVEDAVG